MTTQAVPSSPFSSRPSSVVDLVRGALESMREDAAFVVVSVPAPLAPLETLLDTSPTEEAILWEPAEGPSFAALGAVETLVGSGTPRSEQIRRAADALWSKLQTVNGGDDAVPAARFFGGFSFQAGGAAAEPWLDFGDARFVLPRLCYARVGERAWLSLAARKEEATSDVRRRSLIALVEGALAALRTASLVGERRPHRASPRVTDRRETSEADFRDLVETARARVADGELEKVVVARCTVLTFDAPPDPVAVIAELTQAAAHCTRFSFRFGRTTFLGATPERLIRKTGLELDTEALAGSNRPGDPARSVELLESPKERAEHAPVVREIVRNLSPLCETLDYPAAPEVRSLRHVLHLRTPIRGRLSRPVHVLHLALRLHPTPAVGGVPAKEAMRFIVEHEPALRGWYASPVGWFDATGDGELAVALRSGAFIGDKAYLYAGGGIMQDSDPASEYEETRLKLAALCAALHVAQ
jgi:isochorismate synthase